MDAIRCKEWRIFPGLSLLGSKTGQVIFILTHTLLFTLLFFQLTNKTDPIRFIQGFELFMISHMLLHLLFLKHKKNEFKDWISWTLILGAGLFGLADLIIN